MREYLGLKIFLGTLVCLFLGVSSMAFGEPREEKPDGINVKGIVMHPGADLGVGFDSYIRDLWRSVAKSGVIRDGYMEAGVRFRSHLEDDSEHSWKNKLRFGYRQYFGAGLGRADYSLQTVVRSEGDFFKKSLIRFDVVGQYRFSDVPEDEFLNRSYQNHDVLLGTNLHIQPGEGKVIAQRIGYSFHMARFSDFKSLSHFEHKLTSLTRWNFLPLTSMTLLIDQRFFSYWGMDRQQDVNSQVTQGLPLYNLDSRPLRIKYGLQGLLLSRLSFGIGAGYGYSFFVKNPNLESVNQHFFLFDSHLSYSFAEDITLRANYRYDFHPYYGGLYRYHEAGLNFNGELWRRILLETDVRYQRLLFKVSESAKEKAASKLSDFRADHHLSLAFGVGYRFWEGFKLTANYNLRYYLGKYEKGAWVDQDYTRHVVLLKVMYEY